MKNKQTVWQAVSWSVGLRSGLLPTPCFLLRPTPNSQLPLRTNGLSALNEFLLERINCALNCR